MDREVKLDDVIMFIRESQGIRARKLITGETLLERDLGITGDDGDQLLAEAQEKFGVSFLGSDGTLRTAFGLAPDEYLFHGEGCNPFALIANLFGVAVEKVKPLSVRQLHEVIVQLQGQKRAPATAA
jgi:hypothetical protein